MAPELQKYYEASFNTFSTQGWKDLMEDFLTLKSSINDISTTTDSNNLFFRKGQLDILDLVLNRKAMCEQAYEELTS
jgi:hypothetical protein